MSPLGPENGPSDYDIEHMGDIIAGHGDWFSAHLLRLFAKADTQNRFKLAAAFPAHAAAFLRWNLGLTPFPPAPAQESAQNPQEPT